MSEDRMSTEEMVERVEQVERLLDQLVTTFKEEREANAEAFEMVERALSGGGEASSAAPPAEPVPWGDRATTEDWHALAEWVDWLIYTYELRDEVRLTSCWPAHPGVVEELAALRSAWRDAATRATEGDNDALAFWHDRYLAPLVHRLPAIYAVRICRNGHEPAATSILTDRDLLPELG